MHSPPGSPPDSSRRDLLVLGIIVVLGAWLRFTALANGLPASPQVDEPEIVDRALRMMQTGTYNPAPFFDYPTLYIYLQAMTAVVRFIWGAMNGLWSSLDQLPQSNFYWEFYVWGRAMTATFGTATIIVTYAIGRRLSATAAFVAAALLAIQPLHVRESHYVLTDTPMTFFVALAILLSVRAYERGTVRDYLLAGIATGLAAATKYNGGVVILMPLLALLFGVTHPRRAAAFVAIFAGAAGAFIAAAPYTILDLPAFLNAFGHLAEMYGRNATKPEAAYITYLKHLRNSLGWSGAYRVLVWAEILAALALLGYAAIGFFRRREAARLTWAACTLFVLVWFIFVSGQNLVYARYLLPLLPPLCVMAGGCFAGLIAAIPAAGFRSVKPWTLVTLLAVLVMGPPLAVSRGFARDISKVRTTDQAYSWLMTNLPTGSRVSLETRLILLPADHFVSANLSRLSDRTFDDYAGDGVQYLVAVSQSFGPFVNDPAQAASPVGTAYRELFRRLELIHSVNSSDQHPGPEVRVYRLVR